MKPYAEFRELLDASRLTSFEVAAWLTKIGFTGVRILPASTTPNEAERFDHSDTGDIEITQRIEVKHWPKIDFQSLDDVPYKNIIVDQEYLILKAPKQTLYGYLIVNASKTACLFISGKTADHWFPEDKFDRTEKMMHRFMMCPKELVVLCRLKPLPV